MKISVITICKDCINDIQPTMESIFNQTYKNIESIVIDGESFDGTQEYLIDHRDKIAVMISESDSGIYDAMNKGVIHATGEYLIFMNAGDRFRDNMVLSNVIDQIKKMDRKPNIVSGRSQYEVNGVLQNIFRPAKPGKEGPNLPHQATFIRTKLHKKFFFKPYLRYVGDYEFWQQLKKNGAYEVEYLSDVVSVFAYGGASTNSRNDMKRYVERAYVDSHYTNFGLFDWQKFFLIILIRKMLFLISGEDGYYKVLRRIRPVTKYFFL
jgi:glycosyltransferase involved in cell wall biosynthesis